MNSRGKSRIGHKNSDVLKCGLMSVLTLDFVVHFYIARVLLKMLQTLFIATKFHRLIIIKVSPLIVSFQLLPHPFLTLQTRLPLGIQNANEVLTNNT